MGNAKELLKHGRNYLFANLANKAVAFLAIPVFTRLLSSEEYGLYSLFIGAIAILQSCFTLNVDTSIGRYYFDKKDEVDFKRFVGTSAALTLVILCITIPLFFLFSSSLSVYFKIPQKILFWAIPIIALNILSLTFEQIYGAMKKSALIAKLSSLRIIGNYAFAIALIIFFTKEKYMGAIIGMAISAFLMSLLWTKYIVRYFLLDFTKEKIKYILTYTVPLIPYVLSGVIIDQFSKISIANYLSLSEVGFYSLALSIGGITAIAISISHQAWNPYYFEYMNSSNYKQLDKDFDRIYKITALISVLVSAYCFEIGLILSTKEYTSAFYLIPIIAIGYLFYQLSYVYMRTFGYAKKTIYSTLSVGLSSASNVLLNILLVPTLGVLGAALAFSLAYLVMVACSWGFHRLFIASYAPSLRNFMATTCATLIVVTVIYFMKDLDVQYIYLFLLRSFICLSFLGVVMRKEIQLLRRQMKNIFLK